MRNYRKSSNSSARFHPKPCPYVQQPQIKSSKIAVERSVWALLLYPEAHSRPKPPVHQEASTFPRVWPLLYLTRCVQLEHYVKNCIHTAIVLDVAKNVRLRACRHWSVSRSTTCWLYNHGSWQSPWHTPRSRVKEALMSSLTNLSWHMDVKCCYHNRLLKTYWKYSDGHAATNTPRLEIMQMVCCPKFSVSSFKSLSPFYLIPLPSWRAHNVLSSHGHHLFLHLLNGNVRVDVCLGCFPIPATTAPKETRHGKVDLGLENTDKDCPWHRSSCSEV